ncbi:hypothetical protein LCGC14_0355020 [marine sediment metagenome]|uniref:Uncharacterized protein n=1 Tax=marine sediment metagenome TaxID=412755 RepID=A0A0F9TSK4_9ZZZZ
MLVTKTHQYEEMKEEMRPQDETMDGSGLTFETLEHGGEFPDTMPQAIKAQDAEGRWCLYLPAMENGKVVRSLSYQFRFGA